MFYHHLLLARICKHHKVGFRLNSESKATTDEVGRCCVLAVCMSVKMVVVFERIETAIYLFIYFIYFFVNGLQIAMRSAGVL